MKNRLSGFVPIARPKDGTCSKFIPTEAIPAAIPTALPCTNAFCNQTGKGDAVVVYKLDRLSRSQKDTLNLIEDYMLAAGVDFISINENFDTSSPFGRAMIGILSVFAQLEKDQIAERFTMGLHRAQ